MRRSPKLDANQAEIVAGLRAVGFSVVSLASVGNGCPDVLAGRGGTNYLLEIKDGKKVPSKRRLTAAESAFVDRWKGQCVVVESLDEALRVLGAI